MSIILLTLSQALATPPSERRGPEADGVVDRPTAEGPAPIIDGEVAALDDWPMTGALVFPESPLRLYCSSTRIAPDVVLTAAHCLDSGQVLQWTTAADVAAPDAIVWDILDVRVPTGWVGDLAEPQHWDVALVFLDGIIEDIPFAVVATTAEARQLTVGTPISAVGWGMTDTDDNSSVGIKHLFDAPLASVAPYRLFLDLGNGPRTCFGDSGGPTFFQPSDSTSAEPWRLEGVTTTTIGQDCAFGQASRASAYRDWLDETLRAGCDEGVRRWCDIPGLIAAPDANGDFVDDDGVVRWNLTTGPVEPPAATTDTGLAPTTTRDKEEPDEGKGCGCVAAPTLPSGWLVLLGTVLVWRRRAAIPRR